jgi:hypothetical protein
MPAAPHSIAACASAAVTMPFAIHGMPLLAPTCATVSHVQPTAPLSRSA